MADPVQPPRGNPDAGTSSPPSGPSVEDFRARMFAKFHSEGLTADEIRAFYATDPTQPPMPSFVRERGPGGQR